MEEPVVGVVFGNVSTTDFRFAVRDSTLKRLDYVQVEHPTDGALVAHVLEVTRETNLSFEDATRMGYHEPQSTRDHLVGKARVIGFRDARGLLQAPRTPVPAGAEVRRVDSALLAHVFGLRDTDGAYLGTVKGYDLRVILDINTLVQKHVSILAKTGSGKSYAVGVLMEELIKKGVPVVVIDPHGEHHSLAQPNNSPNDQVARRRFGVTPRNYGEHIVEYSPDTQANPNAAPFALESTNLEARDIADLLGGKLSNSQMGILHAAVRDLRTKGKDYDLVAVLDAVRESASNAKWTLVSTFESLVGLGIFTGKSTAIESLVTPKKVSILNLKGVSPDVQQLVVAIMTRRLFEARKLGKVPPFMLVLEEAHNFAPERGMATTVSGDVMRTIASEGRKFGMGLMVVSQRPAKVDKNVLSQCNTQLILKVTNPNDLKALASSVEGLTSDSEDEIQRLPVGVAFVSHPRISIPVLVEIRPRETSHGGESVDVMASVRDDAAGHKAGPEDEEDEEDDGDEDGFATSAKPNAVTQRGRAPPKQIQRPPPNAQAALTPVRVAPPEAPTAHVAASAPACGGRHEAGWLEEVADEERFLAASDLEALTLPHLRTLEAELSQKTQALSRARDELGAGSDALLRKLDAHLVRIHDLAEEHERRGRSIASRLLGRKK
ncbi:MAG: ATP-binding protein [Candidatus Thermoplasmatota archaeon]